MSEVHSKRAAGIIQQIIYITIATVSDDGQPWNSPVYYAYDSNLNFYWTSDKNSQHSRNIRGSENVFIVIYDSTVPEGDGKGVYIQAEAKELTAPEEIQQVRVVTQGRKGKKAGDKEFEEFMGTAIRRVYKAFPKKIWINDVEVDENGKYVRDLKIEVPVEDIKKFINS